VPHPQSSTRARDNGMKRCTGPRNGAFLIEKLGVHCVIIEIHIDCRGTHKCAHYNREPVTISDGSKRKSSYYPHCSRAAVFIEHL
jgi:hypothetical protein